MPESIYYCSAATERETLSELRTVRYGISPKIFEIQKIPLIQAPTVTGLRRPPASTVSFPFPSALVLFTAPELFC